MIDLSLNEDWADLKKSLICNIKIKNISNQEEAFAQKLMQRIHKDSEDSAKNDFSLCIKKKE